MLQSQEGMTADEQRADNIQHRYAAACRGCGGWSRVGGCSHLALILPCVCKNVADRIARLIANETPAETASRVHPFNDAQRIGLEQSLADR